MNSYDLYSHDYSVLDISMASLKQTVEQSLLKAAHTVEHQLDAELERLESLNSDDLEKLREQRLKEMKTQALQQQEWQILVRHSYQLYAGSCYKYHLGLNRSTGSKHTLFHSFIHSFSPLFPCMFQCFHLILLKLIEFSTDLLIYNPYNYRTICENWIHVHEFLGTVDPSFQLRLQNQSAIWVWWLHVKCTSTRSTSSVFSGSWRVYWNSWRERVLWSNKEVKRRGLSFL